MIAACLLTDDAKAYGARLFVISGTCKREDVVSQKNLIERASHALIDSQVTHRRRLYCISSDGDSRRRRAMALLTLTQSLPPTSPIFRALLDLRLFNLLCGDDDLNGEVDWKHVLKRFRNTLLRLKGIVIDNTVITATILKTHLKLNGMDDSAATAILTPNDKQDVVLMIQLLNGLANLPPATDNDDPSVRTSRRVIRLLGCLYRNLLETYMHPSLLLSDQLTRLSTAAHIILALYSREQGDFIPIQLYFDVMSMIKNVYFCVAKTQQDDPNGKFWIILLGTDGLEKVFGRVRTMIGNDHHADQLQLTNRIDGAVQCVKILELHPEWGGQSRRITVRSLEEQGNNISKKLDHINPRSWTGDVYVKNVILRSCWQEGRRLAEIALQEALINSPFHEMDIGDGFDILCPFGGGRIVLINGAIVPGEEEETEEEQDEISPAVGPSGSASIDMNESAMAPDLDDIAGYEDAHHEETMQNNTTTHKFDAWIAVGGPSSKPQHKSTILRFCSNPLTVAVSEDRLKRVCGFSKYNEPSVHVDYDPKDDTDSMLAVEDPAVTLVRCNGQVFLAVIRLLDIRVDSTNVERLPAQLLHEPNVRARGQIMCLALVDSTHQPDKPDWQFTGLFEAGAGSLSLRNIEGLWIDVVDPVLQQRSRGVDLGNPTYAFRTAELRAMTALLHERLRDDLHRLPVVPLTDTFPYRSNEGKSCVF